MNVFTTDHPLTTQKSCFDGDANPWLSYVCQVLVLALGLLPVAAGLILYLIATDEDYGPPEAPPGVIEFLLVISAYCLLLAIFCVAGYRLLGWLCRNRHAFRMQL